MSDRATQVEEAAASRPRKRIFYGWWIALASSISFAISGGLYYYGFNAFFVPLEREFGWSRVTLATAISLSRLEGGLAGPISGFLVDRFGPRRIMAIGILLMGTGFIVFSRIQSVEAFYLVFVLMIAMGCSLGLSVPSMTTVTKWFIKRRGLAIGIAMSGMGFGGAILLPVLGRLMETHGWRTAAVVSGLLVWALGLPIIAIMRQKPERYGLLPDGADPNLSTGEGSKTVEQGRGGRNGMAVAPEQSFTAGQALRTPVFWLMAFAFGLRQLVIGAVGVHQIPFLVDQGISQELAATALGTVAILSNVGRVGFGWLGDRYEKRKVIAGASLLIAVGAFILANFNSWWQLIPFLLIYSPGYGGSASLMIALRGEYFGRESFGTISGLMDTIQMFGLVLGPVFAAYVFDVSGSYQFAFYAFTVFAVLAALVMLFLHKPSIKLEGVGAQA